MTSEDNGHPDSCKHSQTGSVSSKGEWPHGDWCQIDISFNPQKTMKWTSKHFFFSVHSRFWWGMGALTPPPNSVFTTQHTHVWNSCTTLITNSQLMSCTHREPRSILDYLNIKALNYICWQHDATRNHKQTSLVLRKTLGEHHLLMTNIFIDS